MFINRNLLYFARNSKWLVCKACLCDLLITGIGTVISFLCAIAVDVLLGQEHLHFFKHIWQIFCCIGMGLLILYVLSKQKVLLANYCSMKIRAELRTTLVEKLFELGPAFTSGQRTGDIANTISSKVECLTFYYTMYLPTAISAMLNAGFLILLIGSFNWLIAVICLIGCIGMFACPMMFYYLMKDSGKKEWAAHTAYYGDCLDSVQGMTTLKSFNANAERRKFIYKRGEELRLTIMDQLKISMLENGILELLARFGGAFSVAVAVVCAIKSGNTEGLVYILFLTSACFTPMLKLVSAWHMGYRGITASYSIEDLLNRKAVLSLRGSDHADQSPLCGGDIVFDHVSFAYSEEDGDVLHDLSFRVPKNSMVALVGPSGGGKSTIAHLVAGFYPARTGSVTVGGYEINEETVSIIQSAISAVWQDSHVFYGSVADNIRMGKPDATMQEIVEAAQKANLHHFIEMLPDGYDTMLGENGMRFSGGERQRIALARAYLKDAPILIFDEATSSLDQKNEKEIQQSFARLKEGRTSLVIAHRLSTIQEADQICVVEHGRITAVGTHKKLAAESKIYQKLMGKQMKEVVK